ncbi:hypothetical protein [Comamonas thiooxydans]|uniref:hypothetical protein n=1 Tax=Comamonas thiooxydans TaxID=363952 RepID=UPI00209BF2A4|nr:hypothetical protein [Comamonas thiooxydans]MCO8251105.1 hypothetical protein [Comamonas thiooxydans]
MRGLFTFATASVALACSLSFPAVATGAKQNAKAQTRVIDDGYAKTAVNLSDQNLPPNFRGYSCTEIVKGLKSINTKKDDFESKQAFEERLMNESTKRVSGTITAADPMVFVYDKKFSDLKYDAEVQSFKGRSYFGKSGMLGTGDGIFDAVRQELVSSSSRTYTGTNGFGAKTKVEETVATVCGLIFKPESKTPSYSSLRVEYNIPMEPEKARSIKDSIKVAFVGALAIPYLGRYAQFIEPTITNPYDLKVTGDAVVMRLDEVLVFDERTGEIYARIKPTIN